MTRNAISSTICIVKKSLSYEKVNIAVSIISVLECTGMLASLYVFCVLFIQTTFSHSI